MIEVPQRLKVAPGQPLEFDLVLRNVGREPIDLDLVFRQLLPLAPEKLPPDVGAAAAALAREGKLREALGLLYRGSLSELVHKRGVRLLASHTEGDVIRLSGDMSYLAGLIHAWQSCAYASRVPPAHEVERLAADYGKAFA